MEKRRTMHVTVPAWQISRITSGLSKLLNLHMRSPWTLALIIVDQVGIIMRQ